MRQVIDQHFSIFKARVDDKRHVLRYDKQQVLVPDGTIFNVQYETWQKDLIKG